MSARKLAAVLTMLCACALLAPVAASAHSARAATAVSSFRAIPMTGTAINGKKFSGKFSVVRFVNRDGKTFALGTLTGTVGRRSVTRSNVAIPISVMRSGSASAAAACPILHLELGPLDLNLLGLKVHLNQVVLDITAYSGNGALLGNLLCAVSNLLNQPTTLTQQVTALMNILQQVLNVTSLLGL